MRVFLLYSTCWSTLTFNDISHINSPSKSDESVKSARLCPFPVCWFNISICRSRHSPFPVAFLTSLLALFWTPVWGTDIYCPNSSVCSQHGCLGEHRNNLLLPLKHTLKLKMCTQSHDNPRWAAKMFAMLQSLCPAELTVRDRDKQHRDIQKPWPLPEGPWKMEQQIQHVWRLQLFCGMTRFRRMKVTVTWTRQVGLRNDQETKKVFSACLWEAQNSFPV